MSHFALSTTCHYQPQESAHSRLDCQWASDTSDHPCCHSQLGDMSDYDHPLSARPTMLNRQKFHVRIDTLQHVRQHAQCSRYATPLCLSCVRLGPMTIKLLSSFVRSPRPVCCIVATAEELFTRSSPKLGSEIAEDGRCR